MDGCKQTMIQNKVQQIPDIPAKSLAITQAAQNQTALGVATKPVTQSNKIASDSKKIMSLLRVGVNNANKSTNTVTNDNVSQNIAVFKSPLNNMFTATLHALDNSRNEAVKIIHST